MGGRLFPPPGRSPRHAVPAPSYCRPPTPYHFPDPWDSSALTLQRLFERVAIGMEVDRREPRLLT